MLSNHHSQSLVTNRYNLIKELGSGSMGKVYHVTDRLSGQDVALKRVLLHNAPDASTLSDDSSREQNLRLTLANEFQMLASLHHPNVISVLDYGFYDGKEPYFTMSLLEKPQTVTDAAKGASLETKGHFLAQILHALNYIHRRGLVHRDLKPTNILCEDDHIYVLDFGLATHQTTEHSGETVGTLAYMAPEVLMGSPAFESSDLYAVGIIAYELLAGEYPFNLEDTMQLIYDISEQEIDVSRLDVNDKLSEFVRKLVGKSPEDRYPSAQKALEALNEAIDLPDKIETDAIRNSFLQAATFVGRVEERKTLTLALNQLMKEKTGSAWMIGGESGVGKSRLVDEIRTQGLVTGATVLVGQAISEGGLAYQLWRTVLRRLALMVTLSDDESRILKLAVPDIASLVNYDIADPPELGNDLLTRLSQVVEQIILRSANQQPILLIMEDLQWASESLVILQSVLQRVTDTPIMVVGTYRNDERPDLPDDLPNMQVLELERLNDKEIAQLTTSIIGEAGEQPQVVEMLQRETEGNVFFLIEVVRVLAEDAGSLSEVGQLTLPPQVFAGGVQEVITRRLMRIPNWAHSLMYHIAVAGRQLDTTLIEYILSENPAILQDNDVAHIKHNYDEWLTVCNYATILEVQDEQWRFVHDKLREGVIQRIPVDQLQDIYRTVAESIETVYADQLDDYAFVLSGHWAKAGNTIKEGHYAFIAGQKAHGIGEHIQAKQLFERAVELQIYKHAPDSRQSLADVTFWMGRSYYSTGSLDEAKKWQHQALKLYQELKDTYGIAEATAALGEIDLRQGENEVAKPRVEESLRLYQAVGATKKVSYAYMSLGVVEVQMGNIEKAKKLIEKSNEMMEEIGEPIAIARTLNNLAVIHDMLDDKDHAMTLHMRALKLRREINDRMGIGYSLLNMATIAFSEKSFEEAQKLNKEAVYYLRSSGEAIALATALHGLGNTELKLGNYEVAFKAYRESLVLRRQIGNPNHISQSLKSLGNIEAEQYDYGSAKHYYREALHVVLEKPDESAPYLVIWDVAKMLVRMEERKQALTYYYLAKFNLERVKAHGYPKSELADEIEDLQFRLSKNDIETAKNDSQSLSLQSVIQFLSTQYKNQ